MALFPPLVAGSTISLPWRPSPNRNSTSFVAFTVGVPKDEGGLTVEEEVIAGKREEKEEQKELAGMNIPSSVDLRRSVPRDRLAGLLANVKPQIYHDPSVRGPGSHSYAAPSLSPSSSLSPCVPLPVLRQLSCSCLLCPFHCAHVANHYGNEGEMVAFEQ